MTMLGSVSVEVTNGNVIMNKFKERYQKRIDEAMDDEDARAVYESVKSLTEDKEWTPLSEVKEDSGVDDGFEDAVSKLRKARLVKRTYYNTREYDDTALYKPIPILRGEWNNFRVERWQDYPEGEAPSCADCAATCDLIGPFTFDGDIKEGADMVCSDCAKDRGVELKHCACGTSYPQTMSCPNCHSYMGYEGEL